jgi:hypothetical protein
LDSETFFRWVYNFEHLRYRQNYMGNWIRVVTQPLGLAGFALFLMFTFIGRQRKKTPRAQWAFYAAACVALVGGLTVAYRQGSGQTNAPKTQQMQIGNIQQNSTGNQTVNAAGVQGNVSTDPSSEGGSSDGKKKKEDKQ